MREEVFRCHSLSVARFAFQACLIDRSGISPSLESTTYEQSEIVYRKTLLQIPLFWEPHSYQQLAGLVGRTRRLNCVRPRNLLRSIMAVSLASGTF
jgi:hypothetical protein